MRTAKENNQCIICIGDETIVKLYAPGVPLAKIQQEMELAKKAFVTGIPPEAISIILCVDPIAAMFNGVCNESANITTTLLLAKENNMLDEEKYSAS